MPQFDFSTYSPQIFWLIICFSALYFFSSKIILPRILEITKNRKNVIDKDVDFAKNLEEDIIEINQQASSLKAKANQDYQLQLEETIKKANKKREQTIEELKNKIDQKIEKSRLEIKNFLANSKDKNSSAINDITQLIKKKILN